MPKVVKTSTPSPSEIHVALLRGINVGGKNKLPMSALSAMFCDAGCRDVQTYIQSGNVIFFAADDQTPAAAKTVSARIKAEFGYQIPIVIRSLKQMREARENNPFLKAGVEESLLHAGFLSDAPAAEKVASLEPDRSPGDSFAVVGREIYLSLPNGVARSKLTNAWFDSKLKIISTFRNWRTFLQLIEMMETSAKSSTGAASKRDRD